jgi:tetratricopeptide (TPR) repeat protein
MTSRRHSLLPAPPPLTWQEQAATLDGAAERLSPVFWTSLRSVQLWMETRPETRAALFMECSPASRERFGAAMVAEPGIAGAFQVFVSVLDAPMVVGTDEIAAACDDVRAWAEERGHMRLAALFAEWAAYADPESAARANHAGRLCRRTAQTHRAEVWYDRALKLGIRSREPDQQLRAQLGYGNLLRTLGRFEEARSVLIRAARRAGRYNRKRVAAEAHHDLLVLEAQSSTVEAAEAHLSAALALYPYKHPRLPVLVHDWGGMLLLHHYYSAARSVLEQVCALEHTDRHLEALSLSNLAVAYSATANREGFIDAQSTALQLGTSYDEFLPGILLNIALGWRACADWDAASSYAKRALDSARVRSDKIVERSIQDLIVGIAREEPIPMETQLRNPAEFEHLLRHAKRKLRRWSSPSEPRIRQRD